MSTGYTNLIGCFFPGFLNSLVNFLFSLINCFFNLSRMDPTISNQLLQGNPGLLSSNWVKAGNHHCFRGIINDQVNPKLPFKRLDIPSFSTNDPSFHIIIGQRDCRDSVFSSYFRSHSANHSTNNFACFIFSLFFRLFFFLLDNIKYLGLFLFFNLSQQCLFSLLPVHFSNLHQFLLLPTFKSVDLFSKLLNLFFFF